MVTRARRPAPALPPFGALDGDALAAIVKALIKERRHWGSVGEVLYNGGVPDQKHGELVAHLAIHGGLSLADLPQLCLGVDLMKVPSEGVIALLRTHPAKVATPAHQEAPGVLRGVHGLTLAAAKRDLAPFDAATDGEGVVAEMVALARGVVGGRRLEGAQRDAFDRALARAVVAQMAFTSAGSPDAWAEVATSRASYRDALLQLYRR